MEIPAEDIEKHLNVLKGFLRIARSKKNLAEVEALVERMRVDLILERFKGSEKRVYRALIDFFEDALDERYEKEKVERGEVRKSVLSYVKRLIQGVDET